MCISLLIGCHWAIMPLFLTIISFQKEGSTGGNINLSPPLLRTLEKSPAVTAQCCEQLSCCEALLAPYQECKSHVHCSMELTMSKAHMSSTDY